MGCVKVDTLIPNWGIRQKPSPLNFCLERYSFNAFALSEKYALLAERIVEFSQ